MTGGQACEDVTNDNACATVNDVSVPSPWTVNQKTGGANQFAPTNFFEGGINLTKLKVDACISSFLVNTRASASGDAELHDMIIGKFDRCTPALTTQASTNATNVLPGATGIFDRATVQVSGATNPADATGSVTFYLCPAATPDCTSPQVGSAVTLSNADCDPVSPNSTDGKSCAKSATTTAPTTPGKYCFRAVADLTNYGDPDAYTDTTNECFTVAQLPTSISTAQKWTPQDSATVTPAAAAGTVVFSLYENGTCTGPAVDTYTDTSAPYETNNTTHTYAANQIISWSATFTPTDTATYQSSTTTRCERSDLTINNSAAIPACRGRDLLGEGGFRQRQRPRRKPGPLFVQWGETCRRSFALRRWPGTSASQVSRWWCCRTASPCSRRPRPSTSTTRAGSYETRASRRRSRRSGS